MADSNLASGGKHKAPPSEPVDDQAVNSSVPGYYNRGPAAKAGAGGGQGSAAGTKESGFFASCCACFSGGQTAK